MWRQIERMREFHIDSTEKDMRSGFELLHLGKKSGCLECGKFVLLCFLGSDRLIARRSVLLRESDYITRL